MTGPVESQPRVSFSLPMSRPMATWVLVGCIAVVFGVETLLGGSTDPEVLVHMGAKFNPLITAGQYWRLFTYMFLHIGLMHLGFNGYALIVVGTELERILGLGRFVTVYLLSGLIAGLSSYAFSRSLSAGASGAIFGIIGALAAFFMVHRDRLGSWGQRRLINIGFLIVLNLFLGFTRPGIDNMAHMGGLVSGLALGWALAPRYRIDPVGLRLEDSNRLGRYWPAIALAAVIFVGGTALVSTARQDSPASRLLRAQDALEREDWNEAVVELEQAVRDDPELVDAHFYLGLARNGLDQPELAAEAYESALALEPDFSPAQWALAVTYLELGRDAEARSHFESYLQLNPDEAEEVQPYLDELRPAPP